MSVQTIHLDLGEKGQCSRAQSSLLQTEFFPFILTFKIFKSENSKTRAGNLIENITSHKEVCVFIPCFSSPWDEVKSNANLKIIPFVGKLNNDRYTYRILNMYFLEAEGKFFWFPESISVTTELVKLRCHQKLAFEIYSTGLVLVSFYIQLKHNNVSSVDATSVQTLLQQGD